MAASDAIYYVLNPQDDNSRLGVSNTVFMSVASGVPIITTDVGLTGRIVRELGTGIIMPRADGLALAQAIEQIKDPLVRQRIHGNAERARQEYSWQAAAQVLIQAYATLVGGEDSPEPA